MRRFGVLVASVLVIAACGGASSGDSGPPATGVESTNVGDTAAPTVDGPTVEPQGFSTVMAEITKPDGEVCMACLWLADTAEERGQGLMGVTGLGEPVGMAFLFGEPVERSFFMFQTPTPLSIAWFAEGGMLVAVSDMAPCVDVPRADCPRYSPSSSYELVVEVFEGGLAGLGIVAGSTVVLIDGSEAAACPLGS